MANYDRGVYEPSDEVRVFDGSEEEEDIEGSRLPLLIVLALLVLAMFGGVVWLAYTQGVARGRGETPVLAAASGPERVTPPQGAGGNGVPYQGFKIYEQPAPSDDTADNAPPAGTPAATPAPAQALTPAPRSNPAPAVQAPKAQPPAPKLATAAPAAPPKTVAALIRQANSAPASKPAPAPAGGPATAAPRQLGLATGTPAPVKAAAVAPAAAKASAAAGYVLQIGAYKSQADADSAWKVYKAKHAALLSAYSGEVQQADLGERGIWYRLRISGFADKDMATSMCDRLKADGGACIPGR
jgi:cell division protein FtsN